MSDGPKVTIAFNRARFGTFSWEGQAPQYNQLGPPGEIIYQRFIEDDSRSTVRLDTIIDTLLYYDEQGHLAGILNTYPNGAIEKDGNHLEEPGNVNMFIRPGGIDATKLLADDAKRRWGVALAKTRLAIGDDADSMIGSLLDGNRRISTTSNKLPKL